MKLYNPTKVYFEKDCVTKYSREIVGKHVLVLTGRNSSKENGSLDDVVSGIGAGVEISVFDEVEPDPTIAAVIRAADRYRGMGVDMCVGVGGGSTIDAAKAVSVLLANDEGGDIEKLFFAERNAPHLPIAAIPTTCGTGSEVTPYSVLTDTEKSTKRTIFTQLYPQLALIDYKYLRTIPYEECVSTCVDAMAHLIEAFLTSRANEYNRFYSTAGMRLFRKLKEKILFPEEFKKIDDGVREKLMAFAMFGGYAIAVNGSGIPHGLANSIPHELKISHGRSVIMFIPGFLRNFQNKADVDQVMRLLGFNNVNEFEEYLFQLLGCVQMPEELWNDEMEKMLSNAHKLSSYPYDMTGEILRKYPGKLFQTQP